MQCGFSGFVRYWMLRVPTEMENLETSCLEASHALALIPAVLQTVAAGPVVMLTRMYWSVANLFLLRPLLLLPRVVCQWLVVLLFLIWWVVIRRWTTRPMWGMELVVRVLECCKASIVSSWWDLYFCIFVTSTASCLSVVVFDLVVVVVVVCLCCCFLYYSYRYLLMHVVDVWWSSPLWPYAGSTRGHRAATMLKSMV